jgi:hypothetical protein
MTKVSLSEGATLASLRCVRDVVVDAIQTIVFLFISRCLAGLRISTCQTTSLDYVYYGHAMELLLPSLATNWQFCAAIHPGGNAR